MIYMKIDSELFFIFQEQTRTGMTMDGGYVQRNGPDSAAATAVQKQSPSISTARNTFSKRHLYCLIFVKNGAVNQI